MNITIGISGITREIRIEVDIEEDALFTAVNQAIDSNTPLQLTDTKGRKLLIPAHQLGYIMVSDEKPRPVGFTVA
ncbi:MAG: DUF3107 domain-containing protein [Actinomycetaceae bacterium]|nr:DUF3107 domain-containing protein [Actinomycetaceae bacterium]